MMRVVHISDVHIRTLQRHDEYERSFENLYRHLDELKPDLVINTGDTVHSKVNISPELVEMVAEHASRVSEYAPYHLILGNHDLNLANKTRSDALSPILENLKSSKYGVSLHKQSGLVIQHENLDREIFRFYAFSIVDPEGFQGAPYPKNSTNIGLFHGSVHGALTDINWSLRGTEYDISLFDGLDYVMMGDVHKQQFFRNGRVCYAGSLIQQDFGEDPDKGFLLWDIKDKESFEVTPYFLRGSRRFYSIKALDDLELPDAQIEPGSRVRVFPPRALTFAEQKDLKRRIKQKFEAHEVVIPPSKDETLKVKKGVTDDDDDLRSLSVQEDLLQEHLKDAPVEVVEKVLEINRIVDAEVDRSDDTARNTVWNLDRVLWNNLFQYGDGNVIDFDKLGQIVGIFSPNASGKSNLIDSINFSLFNKTTTGVSRNVHLINDDCSGAVGVAEFSVDDDSYVVERTLDRVRKKGRDESKGSCSFYRTDDSGRPLKDCKDDSNESGLDRQDTDKQVQKCIGTFDDFMITSLAAQNNPLDIVNSKESKRKEVFYRFLDLDIFEEKRELAKDEFKAWKARVKEIDVEFLQKEIDESKINLRELKTVLQEEKVRAQELEDKIEDCDKTLLALAESLPKKSDKVTEVDPTQLPVLRDKIRKLEVVQAKDVCTVGDSCIGPTGPSMMKLAIDECFAVAAEIVAKEREIEKFNSKKDQDMNKAAILQSVPCGDMFPKCRFLVDAVEAKIRLDTLDSTKLLSELNLSLAELRLKYEDSKRRRDQVQRNIEAWNEIERLRLKVEERRIELVKLAEQERKLVEQIDAMETIASQQLQKRELEQKMKEVGSEKTELQRRLKELQNSSTDLNRKIGSEEGIVARSEKLVGEAKEAQQWCTAYEYYDEAMGKNGIPCTILSRKLPRINEEIAKILSAGVDFGVMVEHDPISMTMPLFLVPREGEKLRPLELASGAQKFLASIAMRVALLRISSLPRCTTFVVDEGFGKLDPNNIEGISRIFDILRTSFKHVLIISHLDVLKDIVDDAIDITTDENGRAHVEVI